MVLVGLVIVDAACDVEAMTGEGIALKSTQLSISAGSTHWLVGCEKLMAPKCVVAIRMVCKAFLSGAPQEQGFKRLPERLPRNRSLNLQLITGPV